MNIHDWIDEVCDVLDIDIEVDEALVLDLAEVAADTVVRPAAPITTFLLGWAGGQAAAGPDALEALAARIAGLAEEWDRPAGSPDPDDIDDDVPDDSDVDHTGESFEEV